MKLPPPANIPQGGTPAERVDAAFRKVLNVPKEELLKREAEEKEARGSKRKRRRRNRTDIQ